MRLKRLEMVGFKSFADKTRVEFEPGVTGIIGPNGCGKSNISDGVRWALGEMSAKSLRSQQMMDVIFNGTATRSSQGMSEVSLTFDNSSGQLPIDYTEVTVSRRLFRSGESEYFINKTQCRLKDVRDLFLDTGVGNDGYYVMAQGKIEFILSAKPEERRELFEEAAGVSKYKARREEALRRLNKVEQDMLRLNDSLAIYKQQIDALDAAVRKARQHQKLREDLRNLEIASLLHSHQNAQSAWEQMEADRTASQQALSDLRVAVAGREAVLTAARGKAEALEQELIELQQVIAQSESDWAKAEAEKEAASQRAAEIREDQSRAEQETLQLEAEVSVWQKTLSTLTQDIDVLRAHYQEAHDLFKEEDQKSRVGQDDLLAAQKELESNKARLLELVRLISHHRNETVRLTSLAARHEEVSKSKERELEKVQIKKTSLEEQFMLQETKAQEAAHQLASARERLSVLALAQAQDRDRQSAADSGLQHLRERWAALEAEKVALERWLAQDPSVQAVNHLRRAPLAGIHGPVSDLFKTPSTHRRLLDRALGDKGDYFIADTLNDAQAAVRHLSDTRQGWATFLVLDRLHQAEGALPIVESFSSQTLSGVVECDEKFRPALEALLGRTYFVGETLFEESLIRGGADPESSGLQATPAELSRLLETMQNVQGEMDHLKTERERLAVSWADHEAARGPLEADVRELDVQARLQQESFTRLQEDRQMAETEERLVLRERDEALQAITHNQTAMEQEEILLTTLEEEETTLQTGVHEKDAALQARRETMQAQQTLLSQRRLESETLRERLLGKEKEDENARGRLAAIEERLTQVRRDREDNTERLVQLEAIQREKADFLQSLESTRIERKTMLTGLLDMRQENQNGLHSGEIALAEARQALEAAISQAQEAEFKTRTLDAERARFEQALRDTYQLSIEDARATHAGIEPNSEELARVRRRLESLGAVNLAAPEEHAQLEERYHFLLTQQQDLLKAKDDLHQAISQINATTREHFKATFDQVRNNFRSLYQQLFQGGEADLVLTDEHNLLDTGVDIMAQPPGKKLQNIALLSGGEKALTAIALLFAFFLVKPSPFCLLDEVDAPLDEANVGRFVKMVKTFSEKTQFIVITHNKKTMEMADVLYGVTMAELGISSLISVKFDTSRSPEPVAA